MNGAGRKAVKLRLAHLPCGYGNPILAAFLILFLVDAEPQGGLVEESRAVGNVVARGAAWLAFGRHLARMGDDADMRVVLLRPLPDLLQGEVDVTGHAFAWFGQVFQFVPRVDDDQLTVIPHSQGRNCRLEPCQMVLIAIAEGAVNNAEMPVCEGKEIAPLIG